MELKDVIGLLFWGLIVLYIYGLYIVWNKLLSTEPSFIIAHTFLFIVLVILAFILFPLLFIFGLLLLVEEI